MAKICCIYALLIIAIACQRQLHFPPEQDLSMLKTDKASLLLPDRIPATDSFLIESNVQWTISVTPSTADWFSLDKMSGSGNVKVYATINGFNLADTQRKATITITAVNNPSLAPVIILITQDKRTLPGENAFGGTTLDEFAAVINTPDGGYIAVGRSDSKNGDVDGVHGAPEDVWVVKFNAEHRILWQRAWGGTRRDFASNIIAAHGSGYIICANVLSSDGNVPGNHGGFDAWLIRIDDNGNAIWSKTFGGSRDELCSSIAKTSDGGYIVVGTSGSNDGDVSGNKGMGDGWIIKIDGPGNRVWQKTLGGSTIDDFLSVTNTLDGGYIAVGLSQSNDGDISGQHGPLGVYDTWAVKLDAAGNVQWNKMYGGTGHDRATSVVANTDGSLMIAGTSESNNGDITGNHGLSDGYLMKISANGDILWVKAFGGSKTESIYHILKTSDNYYILSGTTESPEVDFVHYKGSFDGWLIKVNATGDIIGQQLLGGSDQDKANWLVEAIVGEYVLVGSTRSNDKNIIGAAGDSEAWLMRFGL